METSEIFLSILTEKSFNVQTPSKDPSWNIIHSSSMTSKSKNIAILARFSNKWLDVLLAVKKKIEPFVHSPLPGLFIIVPRCQ